MSFLLDEPLAPPGAREAQVRRALLTSLDRRLFPLAGRLLGWPKPWRTSRMAVRG